MNTATNGPGVVHRTAKDEDADAKEALKNFDNERWMSWPNEGAFDALEEHYDSVHLKVKGAIPVWAAGSLFRTGPGQSAVKNTSKGTHYVSHWFDGLAHTHRFDIIPPHDGQKGMSVLYSSRRQSEKYVSMIRKHGWQTSVSFGQRSDPCVGIFAKFMSTFLPQRFNNNVAVVANMPGLDSNKAQNTGHRTAPENMYIATDNSILEKIDPTTLEPLGYAKQVQLHPQLKGPLSCAHAQRDPVTGDLFNFNVELGIRATYRVFRVNAQSGTTDILATISEKEVPAAYIHSFFLTENYVVLCIPTSHFAWSGLRILWERNVLDAIQPFDEAAKCKWLVVDRRHGRGIVARFSTPASFFFHSVNSFEDQAKGDDGEEITNIFLDMVEYVNTDIMYMLYYDVLMNRNQDAIKELEKLGKHKTSQPKLVRYKFALPSLSRTHADDFSLAAERVFTIPSPHAGELPVINPTRSGKRYRYVYGTCNRGLGFWMDAIVKTDVETRDALIWSGPIGHTPGEPIFVPRAGGTDEDDGVILTVVLDGSAQTSYLLCLDGKTLQEVGRAETDFPIPIGLHGMHAPFGEQSTL
ncbi:carotenoid cleavage dioxygenase 1 [Metarhizium album ARSEF 1941]|uniref:Carotenoid cleavage dioxygenase 1 n=1 Tax=Metarhizium album (strain ARSEF 1941) TaxID=1081103 RepID=A0A0B2WQG5_METAS|nr:carotenoid cleavage dioxygenase 1 [Metarhizium album ARSEF 1941]KHN95230.1 carotenoid cleavage dioxygenase 1 [Metarhizium album ARSEF 1941]